VLESPLGEPCNVVPLPFAAAALQEAGLLSDGQWPAPATFYRLAGQRLFAALFPSSDLPDHNVRGALDAALAHAAGGIACQLRFDSDAFELASLPWELLCDPASQHLVAQPMSVDGNTFFTTITGLGVGELCINIRARDTLGNETLSDKVTLMIALC
jgi:hypothetical protein